MTDYPVVDHVEANYIDSTITFHPGRIYHKGRQLYLARPLCFEFHWDEECNAYEVRSDPLGVHAFADSPKGLAEEIALDLIINIACLVETNEPLDLGARRVRRHLMSAFGLKAKESSE